MAIPEQITDSEEVSGNVLQTGRGTLVPDVRPLRIRGVDRPAGVSPVAPPTLRQLDIQDREG